MIRKTFLTFLVISVACSRTEPPVTKPAPAAQQPTVPAPPTMRPQPLPPLNEGLPPIPEVNGPLAIKVVYPAEGAPMAARDSNYMIGSVGNGHATLTINGQPAV